VQPRVVGTFAAGYGIERVVVEPATITISGPKKHVEAVESATTDPIEVSGAIGRVTFARHPYVSDPLIQVASSDPVHVTVIVQKVSDPSGGTQPTKPE
jgi:YbbR-like protein